MQFAKRVFLIAAVYGVIALIPQYFRPAPAERAEFFYGFIGIAIAWQIVFFLISRDPVRFRRLMLVGIVEKIAFGIPAIVCCFSSHGNARLHGFKSPAATSRMAREHFLNGPRSLFKWSATT